MRVRGLSVSYRGRDGRAIRALDHVNLEISAREIVGLLGESGCGKSTLGAAMLRLLPPYADCRGQMFFEGRDLLRLSESELCRVRGERISLIWQDPALALNPVISVGAQIGEVLRAHSRLNRRDRRARVEQLLAEVGFASPADVYGAYPHQLSGGQRQRVVIAQAVASRPALVIADEATSKLDAALQNDILALLNEMRIRYGTALLLISHDPGVLAGFADRIVVMYAGRIVEQASAVEIFTNPLHPYTNALLRLAASSRDTAEAGLRQLPAIDGEPPELSVASSGCRFEPRCADKFRLCLTDDPREVNVAGRQVSCFKYGE